MFPNLSGLFGGGNMAGGKPREGVTRTQSILGTLGDMLATAGGGQATFLPGLRQRAMLEEQRGLQVQQAKQERDNAMQDWIARQAWERANPAPQQPTEFDRALLGAGIQPGSREAVAAYRDRVASMARDPNDQFITAQLPNGTFYAGPQSGLSTFMQGSAPTRPQGRLSPEGGAGGNASGGF
jgi:hypothetical protein